MKPVRATQRTGSTCFSEQRESVMGFFSAAWLWLSLLSVLETVRTDLEEPAWSHDAPFHFEVLDHHCVLHKRLTRLEKVLFGLHKNPLTCEDTDAVKNEGPEVVTDAGRVQGLSLDEATVFLGIPYADPPLGPRRWSPPAPVKPWSDTYDATFARPACVQETTGHQLQVSEDCLFLNVFVPASVKLKALAGTGLPVMVWIHGGDFIEGSASKPLYDGRFISNYSNTVVVNIEYRLGAFGFLVTGTDSESSAVGNLGILDQQAALRWVQRNIDAFGGSSSQVCVCVCVCAELTCVYQVTLFGESAGAQAVSLHLMLKSSESLFSRAALQSSPFSLPLKTRSEVLRLGWEFAKQTNCSMFNLECLRSLSSEDVLSAQIKSGSVIINPLHILEVSENWGPFIDEDLIQEQPITAFQKHHWQSYKPVILGTTAEEGVMFVYRLFSRPMSLLECVFYMLALFQQHTFTILHEYLSIYSNQDRRVMLSQIVTDYVFVCPTRRAARSAVTMGGAAWMYVFDHAPSDDKIWEGLSFCFNRTCHGAELPFLFDSAPMTNFTLSPAETLLANQMLCFWGAFAHMGDPGSQGEQTEFCRRQMNPAWPQYTAPDHWPVLNFTLPSHTQQGNRDTVCDFWDWLGIY